MVSVPAKQRRRGRPVALEAVIYALLYRRVSSKEQAEEGGSLAAQDQLLLAAVGGLGAILHDRYEDVISGKRDDRREYQRLLADARGLILECKRVVVIVPRLDRLGRNMRERVRAWDEFKALGIEVYSVKEGGFVSEVFYNLLASLAQEEVRLLGDRVAEVFENQRRAGWLKPGAARWGYRWRDATPDERGHAAPKVVAELHPDEAPYVEELFRRAAGGETFRSLGRWAANLPDAARGGRVLHWSAIRDVLRSPVYIGRQGDYDDPHEVLAHEPGEWPVLVDDDAWIRAQGKATTRQVPLPRQASGSFPLTGLLWCPNEGCGARMRGRTKPTHYREGKGYWQAGRREYVCSGASGYGGCSYVASADRLEAAAVQCVRDLLEAFNRPDIAERVREYVEGEERRAAESRDGLSPVRLRGLYDAETKRLTDMTKLVVDGVIDAEAYQQTRAVIYAEQERLRAEIARVEAEQPTRRRRSPSVSYAAALLASVVGWSKAFGGDIEGNAPALRGAYEMLFERLWPVRVGVGKYQLRPERTELGKKLIQLGVLLFPTPNLVSIEQCGQTRCSTDTSRPTA